MTEGDGTKWRQLTSMARRAAEDSRHWNNFWLAVAPVLQSWVAKPSFLGRVSRDPDHCSDIVVATCEKLKADGRRRLRDFFADANHGEDADRAEHFRNWLRLTLRRVGIDYQRSIPEFDRCGRAHDGGDGQWRRIVGLTTKKQVIRDPTTIRLRARELLDYLDESLTARHRAALELHCRGASLQEVAAELAVANVDEARDLIDDARRHNNYRPAVEMWSQGFNNYDIASSLGLASADEADRLVRAAKRVLQRRFHRADE